VLWMCDSSGRSITWSISVPGAAPSAVAGELVVSAWLTGLRLAQDPRNGQTA
jgi:hypothetical protein